MKTLFSILGSLVPLSAMKTHIIACVCMLVASPVVSASMFSLKCIKLPLWYNGEGDEGVQLISVPKVRMSTPGEWNMIELLVFESPFDTHKNDTDAPSKSDPGK